MAAERDDNTVLRAEVFQVEVGRVRELGHTELLVDLVGKVETAFERESLSWSEVMRKAAQTATEGHATGLGA